MEAEKEHPAWGCPFPSTTCLKSSENKCSTDASKWMAVARREGNLKRNLGKTDTLHIELYKSTFLKKPVLSLHESWEELTKMSCGKRQDREVGHSPDRASRAASPCAGPPSGSSPSSPRRTLRSWLCCSARPTPTSLPDSGSNVASRLAGEHRQRSRLQIERQAGPKGLSARIRDLDFVK